MKRITAGGAAAWGLTLLTLLAFGIRVIGAESSIAYIPDTQIIRQAFDLGQKLAGAGDYNTGLSGGKYPFGLSWILLGVYGVIYAAGALTGRIGSLAEFENFLFTNRVGMHMAAVLSLGILLAAVYIWKVDRPGPIVLLHRLDGGSSRSEEYCSG